MTKLGRPYSTRPKETMVRVDFYIEPEQSDYLNSVAKKTPFSKGEIIRQALEDYINKNPLEEVIKKHSNPTKQ